MHFLPSNPLRTLLVLGLAVTSVAAQSLMNQHGEILLASGMQMPGSNGLSANDFLPGALVNTNSGFTSPVLDRNGTLLFRARTPQVGGIDGTNDAAFYVGRGNGDVHMIVRGGDQAPGLPAGILLRGTSLTVTGLGAIRMSPANEILLLSSRIYDPVNPANTPATADTAYFHGPAGGMQLLAREGDLVPGLSSGEIYGGLDTSSNQSFLINESGTVVIRNQMVLNTGGVTASNDAILLVGTPGNMQVFLREGDVWAGTTTTGEVLDRMSTNNQFPTGATNLNQAGQIAHDLHFLVGTGTNPVTATNDRAIAVWTGGTDVIIARENDQAPSLPAGTVFTDVSAFVGFASIAQNGFNKSGTVFFSANVSGGGTTTANDQAIYLGSIAGLTLVHREGDPAPASLGAGVNFGTTNNSSMFLNDAGQIAFFASLTGSVTTADDTAMFLGTPGNLTVVARENDVVTALPPSVNGPWRMEAINQSPHVTERGHVVWSQSVNDGVAFKSVWLCYTPDLGIRLLLDPTSENWTTVLGTGVAASASSAGTIQSGDSTSLHVNSQGDIAFTLNLSSTPIVLGSAILRGRVGMLQATPASISATAGGTQNFTFDLGAARASNFYWLLGTSSGTRPGVVLPLGPQTVQLNPDSWTQISVDLANSPVFSNTVGVLDANGRGTASLNLPILPVLSGLNLHHAVVAFDFSLAITEVTEPASCRVY